MSFISNNSSNCSNPDILNGSSVKLHKNSDNPLISHQKDCLFCPKLINFKATFSMLNKALFLKYSSSQNYYYTKDIQELIDSSRKVHVIEFKDNILFEEREEYLTRIYKSSEHKAKISYLTEYYKYHKEVPRLFMLPSSNSINHFHDKKRRIEYYKIKRMLADQKKGVVVTGNKDHEKNISESEVGGESSANENSRGKCSQVENKNFDEKFVSRILDHLDSSLNKSQQYNEKNIDKQKKKFTITKNIKNKNSVKIEENKENSLQAIQELNLCLEKLVFPSKKQELKTENQDNSADLNTLIPTEISDIFMEDEKTILNQNKVKEIKINLVKLQKNERSKTLKEQEKIISPKEINIDKTTNCQTIKCNVKEDFPILKNNFLSPTNVISTNEIPKKKLLLTEKINNKLLNLNEEFRKEQKSFQNFKKTKSNSINPPKDKDIQKPQENLFKNIINQKENSKNPKFFSSPEKNLDFLIQKNQELKPEKKNKKVEKFIKIYKNNFGNSIHKTASSTNRDIFVQSKTVSSLSRNTKEISDTLQNLSKVSNSKSFSEKQNNPKHRRINSSSTTMTCKNILKRYQNEMPLGKVQEILFKETKSNLNLGLKIQNNNTLHRKMQSEVFTPKEKSNVQYKPNLMISDTKFINNQIMSRSQVNNRIKNFINGGNIPISIKENNTSSRGRNKSLETLKRNENLCSNNYNMINKNSSNFKKSCSTTSALKDEKNMKKNINNLKHNINARENINPGTLINFEYLTIFYLFKSNQKFQCSYTKTLFHS